MTAPRNADDFSTGPIPDSSEDEDLGEFDDTPEPTTVTIGTATGTVEVTVTEDV